MNKIKVGDKARCRRVRTDLTPGKVYDVIQAAWIRPIIIDDAGDYRFINDIPEYFEKVQEEQVSTQKFKVGDKVRYKEEHHPRVPYGSIHRVIKVEDRKQSVDSYWIYVDTYGEEYSMSPSSFEKVTTDDVSSLIDKANEGLKALAELVKRDDVEVSRVADPSDYIGIHTSTLSSTLVDNNKRARTVRLKPKPAFEPFTTSNGWDVKLEGETLHIGCKKFNKGAVNLGFTKLLKGSEHSWNDDFTEFTATRNGIKYNENVLPWADAERILEALKKAGV
jgi:hypothetical protein